MSDKKDPATDAADEPDASRFGIVDLVDAFTALRHECRSQVKESRATSEMLQALWQRLGQISGQLDAASTAGSTPESASAAPADERFLRTLIQLDTQWTRAVEAVQRGEELYQRQSPGAAQAFESMVAGLSPWRRWLAAPLIKRYHAWLAASQPPAGATMTEGLHMVLAKLRQVLSEFEIERVETRGLPFDGQLMRSISTIVDPGVPAGHVAQELSPAYRYRGRVIKFADVRVAAGA